MTTMAPRLSAGGTPTITRSAQHVPADAIGVPAPDRTYWPAIPVETGALLDVDAGMKATTCAIHDNFPVNPPDSEPAAEGKFHVVAKKFPRHVLVVDDEPLIRWSVTE